MVAAEVEGSLNNFCDLCCGAVAQLGERLVRNEEVSGSIPLSSTIHRFLSSLFPKNDVEGMKDACQIDPLKGDGVHPNRHIFQCLGRCG